MSQSYLVPHLNKCMVLRTNNKANSIAHYLLEWLKMVMIVKYIVYDFSHFVIDFFVHEIERSDSLQTKKKGERRNSVTKRNFRDFNGRKRRNF